jgi:hypothetical protein
MMEKNTGTPYVYLLKNKTTGMKYIGAKYAKNADPDTFWITYFTSSKRVKYLISAFGVNDFSYKIIKKFNTQSEAMQLESKLIKLALTKNDYLNLHCNFMVIELMKKCFTIS